MTADPDRRAAIPDPAPADQSAAPAAQTGEATGVNTIARTIGSSIGTAVVAAVISSHSTPQGLPTDDAFTYGFGICAGVAVLAVGASLALPPARRRPRRGTSRAARQPRSPAGEPRG